MIATYFCFDIDQPAQLLHIDNIASVRSYILCMVAIANMIISVIIILIAVKIGISNITRFNLQLSITTL